MEKSKELKWRWRNEYLIDKNSKQWLVTCLARYFLQSKTDRETRDKQSMFKRMEKKHPTMMSEVRVVIGEIRRVKDRH